MTKKKENFEIGTNGEEIQSQEVKNELKIDTQTDRQRNRQTEGQREIDIQYGEKSKVINN